MWDLIFFNLENVPLNINMSYMISCQKDTASFKVVLFTRQTET